jgi:hypothetical protein
MSLPNVAVIGTPRSGSSFLARTLVDLGFKLPDLGEEVIMNSSSFNPQGYFESTTVNLLNDQLIRCKFGLKYSFLTPPKVNNHSTEIQQRNFSYDLDLNTVTIPMDYHRNLPFYTGQSWDVWGLTRMLPGEKWHKAYSKFGMATYDDLGSKLESVKSKIQNQSGIVVKDSRLTFLLDLYEGSFAKVIYLTRAEAPLVQSIRAHYGNRLFTDKTHSGVDWVSNHFNYAISPSTFSHFSMNYRNALEEYGSQMDIFVLTQEDLRNGRKADELHKFLEIG